MFDEDSLLKNIKENYEPNRDLLATYTKFSLHRHMPFEGKSPSRVRFQRGCLQFLIVVFC